MEISVGKDFLSAVAAGLNALLAGLLEKIFGPGLDRAVLGPVTLNDLAVTFVLILLVLLANGIAVLFVRRKIKPADGVSPETWQTHFARTFGKPLYLLIWICGIYFVVSPLLSRLPDDLLHAIRGLFDKLFDLGVFAVAFWLFFRFTSVLEARLAAWAARSKSKFDDLFVPLLGKSLRVLVPVVGIIFALPILDLPAEYAGMLTKGTGILLIIAVALILFQAVNLGEKAVLARYDITVPDNLQARKVYTQVHVIGKLLYFIISLFTVASVLMLFDEVRRLGTSLIASAGVIGVIIGFAAQKTIANLFAGFQLAMAQPIRLDDVVVVEGEWGRIEEITLTYVVIRIWDDRRLVVPLSYFIEKPFQNWTRVSADLLGSVFVWVDYSLPLTETRQAVKAILENHPLWDKRFWNLQVTDATENAMQLRVLATAADSTKAWDLRCDIREQLIGYIQKNHPESLPRRRNLQFDGRSQDPPVKP
jgi:small-conductance mechanosensitive channel